MANESRDQLIAQRNDLQTSHVLHLLLSVLTGGLWIIAWVTIGLGNANQRRIIDGDLKRLAKQEVTQKQLDENPTAAGKCDLAGTDEPACIGNASTLRIGQKLFVELESKERRSDRILAKDPRGYVIGYLPEPYAQAVKATLNDEDPARVFVRSVHKTGLSWNREVAINVEVRGLKERKADQEIQRVPCPECAELIMPAARRCRYCGADLSPVLSSRISG